MKLRWWEYLIAGFIVVVIVLIALQALDRYDERLAEQEAAAALEPNLEFPSPPPERQWMDMCLYGESSKTKASDDFRYVTVELEDGRIAHVDREAGKVWIDPK